MTARKREKQADVRAGIRRHVEAIPFGVAGKRPRRGC